MTFPLGRRFEKRGDENRGETGYDVFLSLSDEKAMESPKNDGNGVEAWAATSP